MSIYEGIYEKASKAAAKAKPGHAHIDGKLYTFSFNQREWVYEVYEDGFLFVRFNTKTLSTAKRMLKDFLNN